MEREMKGEGEMDGVMHGVAGRVPKNRSLADDLAAISAAAALTNALVGIAAQGLPVAFRSSDRVARGSGVWSADARVLHYAREGQKGSKEARMDERLSILLRSPCGYWSDAPSIIEPHQPELVKHNRGSEFLDALMRAQSRVHRLVVRMGHCLLVDLTKASVRCVSAREGLEFVIERGLTERSMVYAPHL